MKVHPESTSTSTRTITLPFLTQELLYMWLSVVLEPAQAWKNIMEMLLYNALAWKIARHVVHTEATYTGT